MSIAKIVADIATRIPPARKLLNRYRTNKVSNTTKSRPYAFSLWSYIDTKDPTPSLGYIKPDPVGTYTTWPMLTNRRYSGRHMPPADSAYIDSLPEEKPYLNEHQMGEVTRLFLREGEMQASRSSCLFMFFAQWFTDSVLRTDSVDRRKNTSNHNVDLCQIYGRSEEAARILRSGSNGKLRSQIIDGEEYLDYLGEIGDDGKWRVKEHYKGLPYANDDMLAVVFANWSEERKQKAYATGLERGNSSIGYIAISTLFMREHNRICEQLATAHPEWNSSPEVFDERLFQTARMINTVILLKLVVEEYINHIGDVKLLQLDHRFAEKQNWYREPWVAIEFDMLYRWHGLIPDQITVAGTPYDQSQYRGNNALLETAGLGAIITAASENAAGAIGLQNVPAFMMGAEYANVQMGRDLRLQSYNSYRQQFHLKPIKSFGKLTRNARLAAELQELYKDMDQVEFIVGLFAESASDNSLFGSLMSRMVAYDAFTQIYTNPLLSTNVYNAETFTQRGLEIIENTKSVQDMVNRNFSDPCGIKASFDM